MEQWIAQFLILLFLITCMNPVFSQGQKPPGIKALDYLPMSKARVGQGLVFMQHMEITQAGISVLSPPKKVTGKYMGSRSLLPTMYQRVDSFCRENLPGNISLPFPGDSITVFYGKPVLNKRMKYEGFRFEGSVSSQRYLVPVSLSGLPIFVEDIHYILFGDSLRIEKIQLFHLLQVNLLPVDSEFSIEDRKTGTVAIPFNAIDPMSAGSNRNRLAQTIAIVGGISFGIILVAAFAGADEAGENTASCCWNSALADIWRDFGGSCTGPFEWRFR